MYPEIHQQDDIFYRAYLRHDTRFEGIFFLAVKTTGIFCRPGCRARPPRRENVEFFRRSEQALAKGYRPCKKCQPLNSGSAQPAWVEQAMSLVDPAGSGRVSDSLLQQQGIDPVRLRRWCRQHWGMTFHQYQRRWRIAQAVEQIDAGNRIIDSAADAGYQSLSGFNQAFKNLLGESPGVASAKTRVSVEILQTPLGPMYAAATRQALCLLEFTDRKALARQIKRVQSHLNAFFIPGGNAATRQAAEQLKQYFASQREVFDLPLDLCGTDFQQRAWEALMRIPYASTRTYQQQAQAINRPAAIRAVASANAANPLAIVVPCHRVIGKNNTLAGYAGGIWRKRYLLELEAEKAGNRKP